MTVVNVTPPVISGTAQVGKNLHTTDGTWTADDSLEYTYQWERCDAAGDNCVNIGSATSNNYTVTSADVGSTIRVVVTATENPTPPPPDPSGDPYFDPDIAPGTATLPWTTMFSYTPPGYLDLGLYGNPPASGTPDGRVQIVADPGGSGEKCIRFESRNSDPSWPGGYPFNKSEIRTITSYTLNQGGSTEGLIRWFSWEVYLPYSGGGEQFNWPTSGSDTFFTTLDLHANAPGITQMSWYAGAQNYSLRVPSGFPSSYGQTGWTTLGLFRILNADGSRYTANYNRWIQVILGVRYGVGNGASTNGWVDVWVDGANVIPQRPTVTKWPGDNESYYKHGLYKSTYGTFGGNGTSVIYYRRDLIGLTKADVD